MGGAVDPGRCTAVGSNPRLGPDPGMGENEDVSGGVAKRVCGGLVMLDDVSVLVLDEKDVAIANPRLVKMPD